MSATEDLQSGFRTLQRRVDQLGRAIGTESALMVRSIGWNVLASVLRILAQSYRADMRPERQWLVTLFVGFTKGVLEGKQVRGCSRCAGPMVQQDATLVCVECSHEEELDLA